MGWMHRIGCRHRQVFLTMKKDENAQHLTRKADGLQTSNYFKLLFLCS